MAERENLVSAAVTLAESNGANLFLHNLIKFIHVLRHLGVRVSVAESLDAEEALGLIDILDRQQFRVALRSTLVKNSSDRRIFDMAFELFFSTPEEKDLRRQLHRQAEEERRRRREEAERELNTTLKGWGKELSDRLQLTGEQIEVFANLPPEQRERLLRLFRSFQGNPVNSPSDLIARVVESSLNYWRYYMLKRELENGGSVPEFQLTGLEDLDDVIMEVAAEFRRSPSDRILYEDMKEIEDASIPRVTAIIRQMSNQLAERISRRYQKSARRHKVDIRRTIRHNIRYGGVPLQLRYKSRRARRPHLLLICDVSASMARYARFVLQFTYGLGVALPEIECFVFSENLERITHRLTRGGDFAATMTEIINSSREWGRGTDFHNSYRTLQDRYRPLLTRETLVIIVSDAKTVLPQLAATDLAELRGQVRDIIWLNPLHHREWEFVPAVGELKKHCRMFECYTITHLEKIFREQVLLAV